MKKLIFIGIMMANVSLFAQKYNIKGTIQDTLNEPLVAATVMLLDMDSVLVEFTQTDAKGVFEFKSVRDQQCIIKTSYLGYFPQTIPVKYTSGNIDMGILKMEEIGKELMEIVIKEAKAPLRLRGDTVEYDASQFKVPEGSTLEDLLRRLPGLEVGQDGSIEADGKGVSKLTVDGKTFFSDDPKFAIKNLPAEGVSKVQVFDKKNEEALLTGKSTATEEKTMNIELKEEFKKGGFGKVTAGGGVESRGELKGNYNKFDSKNQFSVVGVANNTGRNGLSWDDYQDFMGANAWGNNDDYNYGFGGGNRYFGGGGGGGSGLENKVSQSFFSGNNGGFPTNLLGGANYNYDHKKNRIASRYFYQNTGNEKETFSNSRTFLPTFLLDNGRYEFDDRQNTNHRAEFVVEHDIDSLFTVIATSDLAFVNNTNTQNGSLSVKRDGNQLSSTSDFNNGSKLDGQLINASMLLRKKFKKAGRAIGANFSYLSTDVVDDQTRFSENKFFNTSGGIDSLVILRQYNNDNLDKYVLQANALISEPLSKKFFLKVFYNFSSRNEDGQRLVSDEENQNRVTNNFLSRIYDNKILNQRLGTSLTFSPKIINVTIGAAQQTFDLRGTYKSPQTELFNGQVNNSFNVFIPYLDINANISRNTWISADYSLNVEEPTIENLLPVVDFTNPLYIIEGNPNLLPSRSHDMGAYISHSWPSSGTRVNMNVSYSYFEDQVIYEQKVDENLVTSSKPINYTGGNQLWSNFGVSFPIIRNKLKARLNGSLTGSKSFALVNEVLNTTDTRGRRGNINLDITPVDGVAIYLSANLSLSNTTYDIDKSQDQDIIRNNYNVEFNTKLGKGWFWNSSLAYSIFTNERFGIDQEIPILNMSIYKQFLKGNRGELRLSLYDAFDKNVLVTQNTSASRVFDSRTPSLARYGMLSFSYNIKGMKSSVERKNYWY